MAEKQPITHTHPSHGLKHSGIKNPFTTKVVPTFDPDLKSGNAHPNADLKSGGYHPDPALKYGGNELAREEARPVTAYVPPDQKPSRPRSFPPLILI
ncbi:hypothetical protein NJC40_24875 [Pseudomonas sp. 21LCFQ02]|uniref:hypothetical protein n=1 Tax=Pseudomonas sp. 21LCFQ02 TaxID=2957505 RepID=UPI00209A7F9C|nr:hypothetical protein [Pseudomonas sp. 21LCFQ02]MCO8171006.1 hypothetical protein [Pseudomonas sp. 21LCFQ02]